mmetsp:Transcript_62542/g.204089  ORF Transcript_62542/g.204089 Transcript_62542/m.204089 type:complete len:265 (-) Transcript_62542:2131-2925(-)
MRRPRIRPPAAAAVPATARPSPRRRWPLPPLPKTRPPPQRRRARPGGRGLRWLGRPAPPPALVARWPSSASQPRPSRRPAAPLPGRLPSAATPPGCSRRRRGCTTAPAAAAAARVLHAAEAQTSPDQAQVSNSANEAQQAPRGPRHRIYLLQQRQRPNPPRPPTAAKAAATKLGRQRRSRAAEGTKRCRVRRGLAPPPSPLCQQTTKTKQPCRRAEQGHKPPRPSPSDGACRSCGRLSARQRRPRTSSEAASGSCLGSQTQRTT